MWPTIEMRDRLSDLQNTATELRALKPGSGLIELCVARYLIIRSAGYLETIRDDSAEYFVQATSHPFAVNKINLHLRRGLSAAPNDLIDFTKSFSPTWSADLKAKMAKDEQRLSQAIGSLVKTRKLIAHGQSDSVNRGQALEWAKAAEELGAWFIDTFDTTTLTAVTRLG